MPYETCKTVSETGRFKFPDKQVKVHVHVIGAPVLQSDH